MTNNEPHLHVELYDNTRIDPLTHELECAAWSNGIIAPQPPTVIGRILLSPDLQEVMQRKLNNTANETEQSDLPPMYMPIGRNWEDRQSPEDFREMTKHDQAFSNIILGEEEPVALDAIDLFTYHFRDLVIRDIARVGLDPVHAAKEQIYVTYGRPTDVDLPGGMVDMHVYRPSKISPDKWYSHYAVTLLGTPAMRFVSGHTFAQSDLPYVPDALNVPATTFQVGDVVRYSDVTPHNYRADGEMQLFMQWAARYRKSDMGPPRAITQ